MVPDLENSSGESTTSKIVFFSFFSFLFGYKQTQHNRQEAECIQLDVLS